MCTCSLLLTLIYVKVLKPIIVLIKSDFFSTNSCKQVFFFKVKTRYLISVYSIQVVVLMYKCWILEKMLYTILFGRFTTTNITDLTLWVFGSKIPVTYRYPSLFVHGEIRVFGIEVGQHLETQIFLVTVCGVRDDGKIFRYVTIVYGLTKSRR